MEKIEIKNKEEPGELRTLKLFKCEICETMGLKPYECKN